MGMEVPGDIKGELCNMKTHLEQRNGTDRQPHAVFFLNKPTNACDAFYVGLFQASNHFENVTSNENPSLSP